MAYLDQFMAGLQNQVYAFSSKNIKFSSPSNDYAEAIWIFLKDKSLFANKNTEHEKRVLSNVLVSKAPELNSEQRFDLLRVEDEGKIRMKTYIRQYALPLEVPQKRIRRKLKTFSKPKNTSTTQKSAISRLSKLNKGLTNRLQNCGNFYDRVLEYPLAISDEFGDMRNRNKSSFKMALLGTPGLESVFDTVLPLNMANETEVIVDLLKFIHCPPAPDLKIYQDLVDSYWHQVVMKLGFKRNAEVVTLVIDKPDFLPLIRSLLHSERKTKQSKVNVKTPPTEIKLDDPLLFGQNYATALQNKVYKVEIINILSTGLMEKAKEFHHSLQDKQVIIDSPTFGKVPKVICNGEVENLVTRANNKGEADCGVWFHARASRCAQVLVCAGDTDIYMYGLSLMEMGYFELHNKQKLVAVERVWGKEYVNINEGLSQIHSLDGVRNASIKNTFCTTLLALYLLSGSDYVSGFYRTPSAKILETFLRYVEHISPSSDPLVEIKSDKFLGISESAFTRLMCCTYLAKHSSLYGVWYPSPVDLYNAFQRAEQPVYSKEMDMILKWLAYQGDAQVKSLPEWSDFTRRVCYFDNHGSKELFKMILPSDNALKLHKCRAEYILKLALESCTDFSDSFTDVGEGWLLKEGRGYEIKWEENLQEIKRQVLQKRQPLVNRCSCRSVGNKCGGKGRGCKNCSKACKPCSKLCVCKAECENPHNNGGTCGNCTSPKGQIIEVENTVNSLNSDVCDSETESVSSGAGEEMYSEGENDKLEYFCNNDEDVNHYLHIPSDNSDQEISDQET